jgi:hypothetical protein
MGLILIGPIVVCLFVADQGQVFTGRDRPIAATRFARIHILERLLSLR